MRPEVQRPRSDHDKVTSCWHLLPGKRSRGVGHGTYSTGISWNDTIPQCDVTRLWITLQFILNPECSMALTRNL